MAVRKFGTMVVLLSIIYIAGNDPCLAQDTASTSEAQRSPGGAGFTVQIAVLANKESVEPFVSQLKQKGYPAYVYVLKAQSGKVLHKIRMGSYATENEARRAADEYTARENQACVIVRGEAAPLIQSPQEQPPPKINPPRETASRAEAYFTIQVSTERDYAAAERIVGTLQQKGYPAYSLECKTQSGKMLYKIRIGKYASESDAQEITLKLQNNEGKSSIIVRSNDAISLPAAQAHEAPLSAPSEQPAVVPRRADAESRAPAAFPAGQAPVASKKAGAAVSQASPSDSAGPADSPAAPEPEPGGPASAGDQYFTLQIATELDRIPAERTVQALQKKGFPAYVFEMKAANGKSFYKIRIGKYKTDAEVRAAFLHFQSLEKKSCIIVQSTDAESVQDIQNMPAPAAADSGKKEAVLEETEDEEQLPEESVMPQEPPAEKPAGSRQALQTKDPPKDMHDRPAGESGFGSESVMRIYAYRESSGALNLTNNYLSIPKELLGRMEYISLFPVRFVSMNKELTNFVCSVDGKQREILLSGFKMPPKAMSAGLLSYIDKTVKNVPLRLKYNPSDAARDGAIMGRLYLRDGTYINLDMVRKGLGYSSLEAIAPEQRDDFKQAEELAKKEKAGMWAGGKAN